MSLIIPWNNKPHILVTLATATYILAHSICLVLAHIAPYFYYIHIISNNIPTTAILHTQTRPTLTSKVTTKRRENIDLPQVVTK